MKPDAFSSAAGPLRRLLLDTPQGASLAGLPGRTADRGEENAWLFPSACKTSRKGDALPFGRRKASKQLTHTGSTGTLLPGATDVPRTPRTPRASSTPSAPRTLCTLLYRCTGGLIRLCSERRRAAARVHARLSICPVCLCPLYRTKLLAAALGAAASLSFRGREGPPRRPLPSPHTVQLCPSASLTAQM